MHQKVHLAFKSRSYIHEISNASYLAVENFELSTSFFGRSGSKAEACAERVKNILAQNIFSLQYFSIFRPLRVVAVGNLRCHGNYDQTIFNFIRV